MTDPSDPLPGTTAYQVRMVGWAWQRLLVAVGYARLRRWARRRPD